MVDGDYRGFVVFNKGEIEKYYLYYWHLMNDKLLY